MRYNRESMFRYTFEKEVLAYFSIGKINGEKVGTSEGLAKIINISPNGMRLKSELHIPETDHKSIELSIRFNLNEQEITCNGVIVWMKELGAATDYGIELKADPTIEEGLIKQLKVYSKMQLRRLN